MESSGRLYWIRINFKKYIDIIFLRFYVFFLKVKCIKK